MTGKERYGSRKPVYEGTSTVDRPFDEDLPASHPLIQTDAACSIPWVEGGFQAVEVFVDPVLDDRAAEICQTLTAICAAQADINALNEAVHRYAADAGLSAGVYERPPDELTADVVVVTFTLG